MLFFYLARRLQSSEDASLLAQELNLLVLEAEEFLQSDNMSDFHNVLDAEVYAKVRSDLFLAGVRRDVPHNEREITGGLLHALLVLELEEFDKVEPSSEEEGTAKAENSLYGELLVALECSVGNADEMIAVGFSIEPGEGVAGVAEIGGGFYVVDSNEGEGGDEEVDVMMHCLKEEREAEA